MSGGGAGRAGQQGGRAAWALMLLGWLEPRAHANVCVHVYVSMCQHASATQCMPCHTWPWLAGALHTHITNVTPFAACCRRLFDAGARRYLLRIETSNPELYHMLHPSAMSWEKRRDCLLTLKKLGFQVGCAGAGRWGGAVLLAC